MDIRKVQRSGNASFIVSLPIEWVRSQHIRKNDSVELYINPDGSLTIVPRPFSPRELSPEVISVSPTTPPHTLLRTLLGAYIRGKSIVEVRGNPLSVSHRSVVNNFLQYTVGQEIVEETPSGILIRDIMNTRELPLPKTIARMVSLTRTMLSLCIEGISRREPSLLEKVVSSDNDLDRLYFLSARRHILFLSYPSSARAEDISLLSSHTLFSTARVIERIGDHIVHIATLAHPFLTQRASSSFRTLIVKTADTVRGMFEKATDIFFTGNSRRADVFIEETNGIYTRFDTVLHEASTFPSEDLVSTAYIVADLRRIVEYSTDIAEFVIDEHPLTGNV